jgi:2Fe-2S ferredoxin
MPKITFLPHPEQCPSGAVVEAQSGETIIAVALRNGIKIEHACEMSCACTTCHVVVKKGFSTLPASDEEEDDLLDRAWGLTAQSRLSCQARVGTHDIEVEIPRYTINQVSERH